MLQLKRSQLIPIAVIMLIVLTLVSIGLFSGPEDKSTIGDTKAQTQNSSRELQTMAEVWAEALKTRDGEPRYQMMSAEMKEQFIEDQKLRSEPWNFNIGVSSPWVTDYEITVNENTAKILYYLTDSTRQIYEMTEVICFGEENGKTVVVKSTEKMGDWDQDGPELETGPLKSGFFEFDQLHYLSALSSSTFDYVESRMKGTKYTINSKRFLIDYPEDKDYLLEDPVYAGKIMTDDMIRAFEKSTMDTVSISGYKERFRYNIFTADGRKTNYCLYVMDGQLWLASYADNTADRSEITMYIWKLTKQSTTVSHDTAAYKERAQSILASMTLEEKVGQMFFVRCRKDTAVPDIQSYFLGGYILFADDIKGNTKDTLKSMIQSYQDASRLGLLIGVDEEGGDTVRISKYREFRAVPFHSPQSLYAEGGFDLIVSDTKEKSNLLKSLGFNVNLAPVCDVSADPSDYIHGRTFGKGARETAQYVKTVVETMNAGGIGCALKHFPGYGNNIDTHKEIAVDNRTYESFLRSDFIPFRAGIDAGAGSVLVSHNIVTCMDEDLPASLSPAVHEILRKELGFTGVIMTDDLKMDAIRKCIGDEVSAVLAIHAGNDLIVASDFDVQIPSVLAAVKSGSISRERIDESVLRILVWKLKSGIIS